MYFVMTCLSPLQRDHAVLKHRKDHPLRSWHSGTPFRPEAAQAHKQPPAEPILARILPGDEGEMAELWDNPVPLMTRRLYERLSASGVDNLDIYTAEIREEASGRVYDEYVAFNLIGKVAAADLNASTYTDTHPPMIDGGFTSLHIDAGKARNLLLFRLAEAVNAIVAHERIKSAVESAGIRTLTFIPPEHWGT